MNQIAILIVVFAAVFAIYQGSKRKRAIKNPRLGFLDVTGGASAALIQEDKLALTEIFSAVEVSSDVVPCCDVLFIYATLEPGGALQGSDRYLRATIRDSGAKVVVVASENPKPPVMLGRPVYGHANLVITLSRNGESFGRFFKELFTKMKNGKPMPMAWVQLAPQIPDQYLSKDEVNVPGTIFACELGGISFR